MIMFLVKALVNIIFPGVAGFVISHVILLPRLDAMVASNDYALPMAVISTGLLTFALASLLRTRVIRHVEALA